MPGMYPDDHVIEIFGEAVVYPGLDPVTHKFTDGSFSDPLVKPSHIPAESMNLILDNLENFINAAGLESNNMDPDQLKNAIFQAFAPRSVGEYHFLSYEPSIAELVRRRYLPLKFQIIEIALYQELCDLKWVGSELNNTADWWYKCDHEGNRTVTGLYMRVEDARGMFFRGAGTNAIKCGANNTPYNGNDIGTFQQDMMQRITGSIKSTANGDNGMHLSTTAPEGALRVHNMLRGAALQSAGTGEAASGGRGIAFDSAYSPNARTGDQTQPASISLLPCMSF